MAAETAVEQAIVHDRCRNDNNGLVQDPDGDVFVLRLDSMMYGVPFRDARLHDPAQRHPCRPWPQEAERN